MVGGLAAWAIALIGSVALTLTPGSVAPAQAAPSDAAPIVYKLQGATDRLGDVIDELRFDAVIKVPHGYVNVETGALQSVNGNQLRVGYDYGDGSRRNMGYRNTLSGGAAGANTWARNMDEWYTIHKVIVSGANDFLVVSLEGDLNIPDTPWNGPNNVVGGLSKTMNLYFSYAAGAPAGSGGDNRWIASAKTVYPMAYQAYFDGITPYAKTGPQIGMAWDNIYAFWSGAQANWGQVLDYGLNSGPEGVLPPNSLAVDLMNRAYQSATLGAAGSVSDSFWYAWVHEDGSLVTDLNTDPIHFTWATPSARHNWWPTSMKNIPAAAGKQTLAYSPEQGALGLTTKTGVDGSIDFREAGGTGYYRLAVWPEAHDPVTVNADRGAPSIAYAATDLFDASGQMTAVAEDQKWIAASAYYKYNVPLPPAPVIEQPADGSFTQVNSPIEITGTGEPGHTITLKWKAGEPTSDFNDPNLTTLVDGDHAGILASDVVVQDDGTWKFTYTPETAPGDGRYSIAAVQTEHTSGFDLTSDPSNPNDATVPTAWGVSFTIDTVAPAPPTFDCLVSPTQDTTPTFTGGGVEPGATVFVYQDGDLTPLGEAVVTGTTWAWTVEPALENGTYSFTARQVDRAGNVSEPSAPACELQVATDVPTEGVKLVPEVAFGDPVLPTVDPTNWEITATADGVSQVLSNGSAVDLERGITYTIGERLRRSAAPDAAAANYRQLGALECLDADAQPLPPGIVDAATSTLTIGLEDQISEPVTCQIRNQTAHVSFVTQRVGGQTASPSEGWELTGVHSGGEATFALDAASVSAEALPTEFALTATAPEGLSLIGFEQLNLADPTCAPLANTAVTAPSECWVPLDPGSNGGATAEVPQGAHTVYRVLAAAPADMPALPMTGGLGSWLFTAGGVAATLVAALALWRRHALQQIQI